jgi:hypothetical protein
VLAQERGAARLKPGRGAATTSMSCSDKLARWGVMGIQGSLLSTLLEAPVRIHTLTVAAPTTFNHSGETGGAHFAQPAVGRVGATKAGLGAADDASAGLEGATRGQGGSGGLTSAATLGAKEESGTTPTAATAVYLAAETGASAVSHNLTLRLPPPPPPYMRALRRALVDRLKLHLSPPSRILPPYSPWSPPRLLPASSPPAQLSSTGGQRRGWVACGTSINFVASTAGSGAGSNGSSSGGGSGSVGGGGSSGGGGGTTEAGAAPRASVE